jgi:RNA polymerase-binding transcription factor DksA
LLELRAALVSAVNGIARESRIDGNGRLGSADKVDAGSDACDRDVALSLVSEGTNALHEIDQALARIATGTYGICEMTGRQIPRSRLEAIPFARFTVDCQSQLEKEKKLSNRARSFESPFSVSDEPEDND